MNMPVTVIGFILVVIGGAVLSQLRAGYLREASRKVSIDPSKIIELRHAIWAYSIPVLAFGIGLFLELTALHELNRVRIAMASAIGIAFILGSIYYIYSKSTERVIVSNDKLVYVEGSSRCEIPINDIESVSLVGFSFSIKRWSEERRISIPATFESSEVILAFLTQSERAIKKMAS
jgi:hypothetical protein